MKKLLCLVVILGLMFVVTEQIRLSHQAGGDDKKGQTLKKTSSQQSFKSQESSKSSQLNQAKYLQQLRDRRIDWLSQNALITDIVQHGHLIIDQNTQIPLDKTFFQDKDQLLRYYKIFSQENKKDRIIFIEEKTDNSKKRASVLLPGLDEICYSLPFANFNVVGGKVPLISSAIKHVKFVLQWNAYQNQYTIVTAFPVADYNKKLKLSQTKQITQKYKSDLDIPSFIKNNFDVKKDLKGRIVGFGYPKKPTSYNTNTVNTKTNTFNKGGYYKGAAPQKQNKKP